MDEIIRYPGVHPSTSIALNAYLAAARQEARATAHPELAFSFHYQARIQRIIGQAALSHVKEPDDG